MSKYKIEITKESGKVFKVIIESDSQNEVMDFILRTLYSYKKIEIEKL